MWLRGIGFGIVAAWRALRFASHTVEELGLFFQFFKIPLILWKYVINSWVIDDEDWEQISEDESSTFKEFEGEFCEFVVVADTLETESVDFEDDNRI